MRIILVCFDSLSEMVFDRFVRENPDSFISKMAREGLRFKNNYTACTFSHPSYPSILFGVYPSGHGILAAKGYRINRGQGIASIQDGLGNPGWGCIAISDIAWIFSGSYGYDIFPRASAYGYDTSGKHNDRTFVFLNYWGCHHPYNLSWSPWPEMKDWTKMYALMKEGKSKAVDALREEWTGRIISNLEFYSLKLEKFDDGSTVIVLCSDHGDDYGLHGGVLHADSLPWDSAAKTPLLVYPYSEPEEVATLSSNTDIKRIILEIAEGSKINIPAHEHIILTGGIPKQTKNAIHSCGILDKTGHKFIHTGDGDDYLYDMIKDAAERVNLFESPPECAAAWMCDNKSVIEVLKSSYPFLYDNALYRSHLQRAGADDDRLIEEQLEGLGYI